MSEHCHQPNHEEVAALRTVAKLKEKAVNDPHVPPIQLMSAANAIPINVLSHMPNPLSLQRTIQRERAKTLPKNPKTIEELGEIPVNFRITLDDDDFLLYDSFDFVDDETTGRILVYTTDNNLRVLSQCSMWHLDGTFSTAAYSKVLQVVCQKLEELQCPLPRYIMTDFELAIINAALENFVEAFIRACLFHLCQSVFRQIQHEGLQALYNDENDSTYRNAARQMCALAFVPVEDVQRVFFLFVETVPRLFKPVTKYFEVNRCSFLEFSKRFKILKISVDLCSWKTNPRKKLLRPATVQTRAVE